MNALLPWYQKLLAFLRVRTVIGGLEISDEVIRFGYFDGKLWQMHAVRLAPNIIERGRIKDREAFISALHALRTESKMGGTGENAKKISVVVVLSSAETYSKVFKLPAVDDRSLEQAVLLNTEMASPEEASKTYSSWQIVGRDDQIGQLEVLASFADRSIIDGVVDALFAAGFIAVAVEPKALAMTRVLRKKGSGVDIQKSYIIASVDNSGMEFLVVRNGEPYFEYINRWSEMVDDKGAIAMETFENNLKTSLRQVLNFYAQQWTDPVAAIILSTVAFQEQVEKTIATNFTFPVVRLTLLMGQSISSEWLVALGSSMRSLHSKTLDHEVSFLGEELEDRFRAEQALRFLNFWRVVIPTVFAILVGIFFATSLFLDNTKTEIEAAPSFTISPRQNSEASMLQASTTIFNNKVALLQAVEQNKLVAGPLLREIYGISGSSGVIVHHVVFSSLEVPISLNGVASAQDAILAFKAAFSKNPHFSAIELPLTGIQQLGGSYSFSMTFVYKP